MDTFRINEKDNVCVDLASGHKFAVKDISQGEDIIKYGFPIGIATTAIKSGEMVHTNNMKTKLGDILTYKYAPNYCELPAKEPFEINAYIRENGDIEKKDLLEKSPFDNYDFLTLFGTNIPILTEIGNNMHNTITAA